MLQAYKTAVNADICDVTVYEIESAAGSQKLTDWFDDALSFSMVNHETGLGGKPVAVVP